MLIKILWNASLKSFLDSCVQPRSLFVSVSEMDEVNRTDSVRLTFVVSRTENIINTGSVPLTAYA